MAAVCAGGWHGYAVLLSRVCFQGLITKLDNQWLLRPRHASCRMAARSQAHTGAQTPPGLSSTHTKTSPSTRQQSGAAGPPSPKRHGVLQGWRDRSKASAPLPPQAAVAASALRSVSPALPAPTKQKHHPVHASRQKNTQPTATRCSTINCRLSRPRNSLTSSR